MLILVGRLWFREFWSQGTRICAYVTLFLWLTRWTPSRLCTRCCFWSSSSSLRSFSWSAQNQEDFQMESTRVERTWSKENPLWKGITIDRQINMTSLYILLMYFRRVFHIFIFYFAASSIIFLCIGGTGEGRASWCIIKLGWRRQWTP